MIYYVLLITFLFILCLLTYKKFNDFFSPSFIVCSIYLISSIFALFTRLFSFWNDIDLSFKTFFIVCLGIGATILGECIVRKVFNKINFRIVFYH